MNIINNLKIEKLVYKGYGLGFKDSQPVFVNGGLPGDILDVKIEYLKGRSSFAAIEAIIQPSPFRRRAECEAFGYCGGCDWLNLHYYKQLEIKQEIIQDIFKTIPIAKINPIISSKNENYYRNKSFFPVSHQNDQPVIGMFAKKSHEVVPHQKCLLHPALFDEVNQVCLNYIKASKIKIYDEKKHSGTLRHIGMRHSKFTNELIVILVTKNRKIPFSNQLVRILRESFSNLKGVVLNINPDRKNVILGEEDKILFGRDFINDELGNKKFKLSYKSFFQVNSDIAAIMYEFVKQQIIDSRYIVDAYCGIGSIGIYVKSRQHKLWGIESNEHAVNDAKQNAGLNNLTDCNFICGNVEDELKKITAFQPIDTIIFDPPRKGLDKSIIENLDESIKKIVYISCEPNTQKRDAELLLNKGFKIKLMQPFDMFPHTFHVENVLVLNK